MASTTSKSKSTTSKSTTDKTTKTAATTAATPSSKPLPKTTPTAKPVVKTATSPKLVSVTDPAVTQADLKKKELTDLVVERSGIKKKDAKPVVEAMLAVLGETIASGRELNLQPLGKLRINRTLDKSNGRVFVCKIRQSDAMKPASTAPLAEAKDNL